MCNSLKSWILPEKVKMHYLLLYVSPLFSLGKNNHLKVKIMISKPANNLGT